VAVILNPKSPAGFGPCGGEQQSSATDWALASRAACGLQPCYSRSDV